MVEILVVVIDTNVCLDLFVFRDTRCNGLYEALRSNALKAVTRADCRREWEIVLQYEHLGLSETDRERCKKEFDTWITCIDPASSVPSQEVKLPVCRDRDDQKFLELAFQSNSAMLITKDKALLKLDKRARKLGLFRILMPESCLSAIAT